MFFSTEDGTFASTFKLDKNVTQPSELFIHKSVWYPNGYKIVASANGQAIDGVTFTTSETSNYI